jgi:hypothetical protein
MSRTGFGLSSENCRRAPYSGCFSFEKSAFLPDVSADPDFDTINDLAPAKNRTAFRRSNAEKNSRKPLRAWPARLNGFLTENKALPQLH